MDILSLFQIVFAKLKSLLKYELAFFFRNEEKLQCSPIIMLDLGSIGMASVISKSFCKGTILQRNYRKMTTSWSYSYISFVKLHGKNILEP